MRPVHLAPGLRSGVRMASRLREIQRFAGLDSCFRRNDDCGSSAIQEFLPEGVRGNPAFCKKRVPPHSPPSSSRFSAFSAATC